MAKPPTQIKDLYASIGERILPKWQELIAFADANLKIRFGHGIKVTAIPGGGINVTRQHQPASWPHPFRSGSLRKKRLLVLTKGTVNNLVPWVTEELMVGDRDKDNQLAMITLKPQKDGKSWVAVGVNVQASKSDRAELDSESSYQTLRLAEIKELPKGLGSGGIHPDADGWAWYALTELTWKEGALRRRFQIVYHNLKHHAVAGGDAENLERHFFYGGG